jgi:hypothetical protein
MSTINVATLTKGQDFPAGTVDTPFSFQLLNADGTVAAAESSTDGTTSFANVGPGTYTVTVTKNGVTVHSDPIVVAQPSVTLQVPASLQVTQA